METRPYFVFGDLVANAVVGALSALLVVWVVGTGWNMFVAMFVGMALGMAIALPIALGFGPLFGAMEVMAPVMVSGMMVGMVVGMWAAMEEIAAGRAAGVGVVCAWITLAATYAFNAFVRREDETWTS